MLGYDEHELSNQPETWQRLIFPEDLPEVAGLSRTPYPQPWAGTFLQRSSVSPQRRLYGVGDLLRPDHRVGRRRTAPADDWLPCPNISDRKAAPEMQLKASEEKFRNYVENANSIIYTLSFEGVFTYASPSLTNLLGYELHEVIGQSFVPLVHPEDQDKCLDFLRLILSGGAIHQGPEYRVRHKNGTWRWHTSQGAPQWDKRRSHRRLLGRRL